MHEQPHNDAHHDGRSSAKVGSISQLPHSDARSKVVFVAFVDGAAQEEEAAMHVESAAKSATTTRMILKRDESRAKSAAGERALERELSFGRPSSGLSL